MAGPDANANLKSTDPAQTHVGQWIAAAADLLVYLRMHQLQPGLSARVSLMVGSVDTAEAVGSGMVPALATPRVLALMESAAVRAIADSLDLGTTTVGISAQITHSRPTPVGRMVEAEATLVTVAGRRLDFIASVVDGVSGTVVANATHSRVVVDVARFLRQLATPSEAATGGPSE
jgi:fluoroacetyl-CoA thioesterase